MDGWMHMEISLVGRSPRCRTASAAAAAAYDARCELVDSRTGRRYDYRRVHPHEELVADLGVALPEHAPSAWHDRQALWDAVERSERGGRAAVARRVEVALPRELTREQQRELARGIQRYFVAQGMVCDACVHDALDGSNPHVHLLMPLRPCDANGFLPKSKNVYLVRDADGEERWMDAKVLAAANAEMPGRWEKIYRWRGSDEELTPTEAKRRGLAKKKSKTPVQKTGYLVSWNDKGKAEVWRRDIAELENDALATAGRPERVDHRSYARQGREVLPTEHEGPCVTWAERRGAAWDRAHGRRPHARTAKRMRNRRVRQRNRRYAYLLRRLVRLLELYEEQRQREVDDILGVEAPRGSYRPRYGPRRAPARQRGHGGLGL